MKTLIVAAIRCSLLFLVPSVTYAISAQWDLDPISFDWNTADNWTPNGVPNGPGDIATFGLSNTTFVRISEDNEVNSIIFTPAATNPYTIRVGGSNQTPITLTLSGMGIINNSGIPPTFVLDSLEVGARMRFTHSASAGNARISLAATDSLSFFNRSTASSASITGGDDGASTSVKFFNASTAGSAVIELFSGNELRFFNNSTAGNATVIIPDSGL